MPGRSSKAGNDHLNKKGLLEERPSRLWRRPFFCKSPLFYFRVVLAASAEKPGMGHGYRGRHMVRELSVDDRERNVAEYKGYDNFDDLLSEVSEDA